jgi:hypothetical protein
MNIKTELHLTKPKQKIIKNMRIGEVCIIDDEDCNNTGEAILRFSESQCLFLNSLTRRKIGFSSLLSEDITVRELREDEKIIITITK